MSFLFTPKAPVTTAADYNFCILLFISRDIIKAYFFFKLQFFVCYKFLIVL